MMQSKPKTLIIGLTGGSGVGKGEVGRILAAKGAHVINADKVAHGVILSGNPAYDEVLTAFGRGILDADNEIDRKKLGAIVFADKSKLALLSGIVHKYVQIECEKIFATTDSKVVVVDAAALTEAGMTDMCNAVIGVFALRKLRVGRIVARDNISREAAEQRIAAQMPDEELQLWVDFVVENNGDLIELERSVDEIWADLYMEN
ncbi:MAG: dephospho-CoA kinase [Defluviitaleaceae bacterium]|nr:dephospho-CoA kinase [Defluviitaleaceae bacterium]